MKNYVLVFFLNRYTNSTLSYIHL